MTSNFFSYVISLFLFLQMSFAEASGVFLSMFFCFFAVFHVTDASGNKVTTQETLDFVEKVP